MDIQNLLNSLKTTLKSSDLSQDQQKSLSSEWIHINILKGSLFKGHKFQVTYQQTAIGARSLLINNNYFTGDALLTYYLDTDETAITYQLHGRTPKWLREKLNAMGNILNPGQVVPTPSTYLNNIRPDYNLVMEGKNPKIMIYPDSWHCNLYIHEKGSNFTGHRTHIDELTKLREYFKTFRQFFKMHSPEELVEFCFADNRKLYSHHTITIKPEEILI